MSGLPGWVKAILWGSGRTRVVAARGGLDSPSTQVGSDGPTPFPAGLGARVTPKRKRGGSAAASGDRAQGSHLACAIRFSTLDALCRELDCQPGDLVVFEPGPPDDPVEEDALEE